MIPNTLTTRGVVFAYLFGPPRFLERSDASALHNAVCEALKLDDLVFRYSPVEPKTHPPSRGFQVQIERAEGRGAYRILLENASPGSPMCLRMEYEWPPNTQDVEQRLDLTADAVFRTIEGSWTRILAEVRYRCQCSTKESDGQKFLRTRLLRPQFGWFEKLGRPLSHLSLRCTIDAESAQGSNPMEGPRRDLTIEVLREDPRMLYIELMSQWTSGAVLQDSSAVATNRSARLIGPKPLPYLTEAYEYLQSHLESLASEGE